MSKCTCGSVAVNGPGHSTWCDFLTSPKETGWQEFIRMSGEGWTGLYIFVTSDEYKLLTPVWSPRGQWIVIEPSDLTHYLHLAAIPARVWVDKNATIDTATQNALMQAMGPFGVIRYCS